MGEIIKVPEHLELRYRTCLKQVSIGKWTDLSILAVQDPDVLIDELDPDEFQEDERLPYWAEIWPSAIGLGMHLFEHPADLKNPVLELGCGTGVAGLAAARAGLTVHASDYEEDALAFAVHNARLNDVSERMIFRHLDWRKPALSDRYALLFGSDIVYDRPDHEPIMALLERMLVPGGTFLLSDPNRRPAGPFVEAMIDRGYRHTPQSRRIRYDGTVSKITVHRFKKPGTQL